VDGTGSGSCPVAGFGISGVEPWGSAATELYSELAVILVLVFCVNIRCTVFHAFLDGRPRRVCGPFVGRP
jgi:hypothetical protein